VGAVVGRVNLGAVADKARPKISDDLVKRLAFRLPLGTGHRRFGTGQLDMPADLLPR
jgi:hypothetical protein